MKLNVVPFVLLSEREDVYHVVKAFAAKGEWMNPESKHYIMCLVRTFIYFFICIMLGSWFTVVNL